MTQTTRGERNNNPGNLRAMPVMWQHQTGQDAGGYAVFDKPFWGIRALARDLYVSWRHDGLINVEQIIHHYAPPVENDTEAYIKAVCDDTGWTRDAMVDLGYVKSLSVLVKAIIHHENGRVIYPDDMIDQAAAAALPEALRTIA